MSYDKHLSVMGHHPADNTFSDGGRSITYAAIPGMLAELDAFFSQRQEKVRVCIGVVMENTIDHALTVLYFLSEGINFFLLSTDSPIHSIMPSFCDCILSWEGDGPGGLPAGRRVRIEPNPAYHVEPVDIKPRSSSAFFSSSGTSGPAKYIWFSHKQLIRNAGNCKKRFGFDHRSRILVPVPVSHMYGLGVGLLPAFMSGASIGLIEKNNVIKLISSLTGFKPTTTLLTPTVVRMLLLLNKRISPGDAMYITAGEKIGRQTYEDFERIVDPLFNLYGCTELGAIAVSPAGESRNRIEGMVEPLEQVTVSITGNTSGQIMCKHNAGFEGYIDSKGMRQSSSRLADGIYATNDMGVAGDNGFKVLGRMDHCVNRSGFLVSLDEIEAILKDILEGISAAVVLECDDEGSLTTKLTAVCEVNKDYTIDSGDAKRICRESMNRYQVPDEFHFVSEMPRLGNGKPDRRLLAAQYKNT